MVQDYSRPKILVMRTIINDYNHLNVNQNLIDSNLFKKSLMRILFDMMKIKFL